MSSISQQKQDFLDTKLIPKIQFQLVNDEFITSIKGLFGQVKNQQKSISSHKKQLQQKLSIKMFSDSLRQLQQNITFSNDLKSLIPVSKIKQNNNNDNPVMSYTVNLSKKFNIFSELISLLNSKVSNMEKRIIQSQQKSGKLIKQKVQSIEDQLRNFVNDYRNSSLQLNTKIDDYTLKHQNKAKQIQTDTLWKINECLKRLESRPNVEMVKSSVSEVEIRLQRLINSKLTKVDSVYQDSKVQQDLIKLQKQVNFNSIQIQSKMQALNEKLTHQFISLQAYSDDRIDLIKKLQQVYLSSSETSRKIKYLQTENQQTKKSFNKIDQKIQQIDHNLQKLNTSVGKFTKTDEFAKILQKIDPHQLCKLGGFVKSLQQNDIDLDNKINILNRNVDAIRSKTQFWNIANSNPQSNDSNNLTHDLVRKLIIQQLNNSQIKVKVNKFQHQIIDLGSLKQGMNEILKKLSKVNKDQDLTNLKYQIKGLQQYIKKQVLILVNRINTLQVTVTNINEKKRPQSALGSQSRLFSSISTKKLIPSNCISCHQTNPIMSERRTVYKAKMYQK